MTISVGELQKNISIIKKANEPIIVVDRRTGEKIARIEPIKEKKDDLKLLEKIINTYPKKINKDYTKEDFEKIYTEHLKGKYGFN